MKVLHMISGGDSGGAKTHVFTLLNALKQKIDVKIICFTDGVFYEMLQDENIQNELLMQNNRYDLSVIKRLKEIIETEGFDLIHAHGARANFIAANLKRKVKIPIITTMHSDYLMDFEDNLYKRVLFTALNSLALRFIDYYLAVSNDFKKMLMRRHFDPGRIFTIYNGIEFFDPNITMSREEYLKSRGVAYHPDHLYVGTLTRFDRVKGIDVLIRAAARVVKKQPNIHFLLAGDGVLKSEMQQLADECGISDHVHFLGFEGQPDEFLNALHINTLTSYSESFPYALLEGGRMKKATVASRVGGIPDLISDGENGYLFESGNDAMLAEKIIKLASSPTLQEEFGQALYETVRDHFTSDCMAQDHIAIYEKAIVRGRKHKRRQDAMLMGYYGFDNSGDEALLNIIISELRREDKNLSLVALTSKPKCAQEDYAIKAVNRFNIFSVLFNLLRTRVLIYGGGSLIQDVTSSKSLFYYVSVIYLAKMTGTKIMLYGNGVGPIIKDSDWRMVKKVLNHVDVITLREMDSYRELKKMEITAPKISITADPAIRVIPCREEKADEILENYGIARDERFFVLSIREWKHFDVEHYIARVSDYVSEKYGLTALYIPLQKSKDLHKSRLAWSYSKFRGSVIEENLPADEIVSIVKKSEFVIGMRLHMLIYAANVCVPAVGLVYDPKIQSFMDYVGQNAVVELDDIENGTIFRHIDDIMQNRQQRQQELSKHVTKLKKLAEENGKLAIELIESN